MKRRIILPVALTLSIISVLLMNSDSLVEAQSQTRYSAGTGVITLTSDENLSLTVNAGSGDDAIIVRFRRTRYSKTGCESGVCRYVVESQTTTAPMVLMPDEVGNLELMGNQIGTDRAASIEVLTSSKNARATVQLSDALAGQTKSVLVALLLP
jgi:hypothetical protein